MIRIMELLYFIQLPLHIKVSIISKATLDSIVTAVIILIILSLYHL